MPIKVKETTGGIGYASALIGDYQTLHVKVDVSALDATQVDAKGFLKPNVPLTLNGVSPTLATAVAQVETLTVAGTVTADGNAKVTVTSALLPGGSKEYEVAVANEDTASAVGGKVRAVLQADTILTSLYTVGGSTTAVSLTALNAGPNDATLNIAIDNDTSTGITPVATSTNTTAGVAGKESEVPCVTIEPIEVAENNTTALATAPDVFVACAVNGTLNRDIMEDTLGRPLTAAEVASLNGPNSKLVLSLN